MNHNKPNRGGKREGSGRPKTGVQSKVIRVPLDFPETNKVIAILSLIDDWKDRVNEASETSPRYEKLREFFAELEEI